jgi:tetratricopeptide (TPR) repeat protein
MTSAMPLVSSDLFAPDALAQPASPPAAKLHALLADADAELARGNLNEAGSILEWARSLAESPACDDVDRAEVFFRLGRYRLGVGATANAASLLTLALDLCDRSAAACDELRTNILDWRSRCYQRQRDWEAARADVERALELAQDLGAPHVTARVVFQASIVAERQKQWLLARFYAEQALELLTQVGDWAAAAKVLNNLGGINFLLGSNEVAVKCLHEARRLAEEFGSDVEVGYALSSLAQLRLRTGDAAGAEADAREALAHLAGRRDHANEVASAELVLARALLAQDLLADAEDAFRRAEEVLRDFGSASHSAAALLAGGDIARRTGNLERAAELYRSAAEALQDVHF